MNFDRLDEPVDRGDVRTLVEGLDTQDVGQRRGQMGVELGKHMRTHRATVSARHVRDADELGDAAARRGVGSEIVRVVVIEELHEFVDAGPILADRKRNATARRNGVRRLPNRAGNGSSIQVRFRSVHCVAVRTAA